MKESWKETEEHQKKKKDDEAEIYAKMMGYYNSATGERAIEIAKRHQEHMRHVEEGQDKGAAIRQRLDSRARTVAEAKVGRAESQRQRNAAVMKSRLDAELEIRE